MMPLGATSATGRTRRSRKSDEGSRRQELLVELWGLGWGPMGTNGGIGALDRVVQPGGSVCRLRGV